MGSCLGLRLAGRGGRVAPQRVLVAFFRKHPGQPKGQPLDQFRQTSVTKSLPTRRPAFRASSQAEVICIYIIYTVQMRGGDDLPQEGRQRLIEGTSSSQRRFPVVRSDFDRLTQTAFCWGTPTVIRNRDAGPGLVS